MQQETKEKEHKTQKVENKNQENEGTGYEIDLSAEFQDLEETTETKTSSNKEKDLSQDDSNEKHYVIPGTMFEGQYDYITKEKKEEDVQRELQELENEKRELEISTQHYINPSTIVQGPIKKGGKELKEEEVNKQLQKYEGQQGQKTEQGTNENQTEKPKVMHRVNRHEFNSTEVPELHQQDIPVNLQPDQVNRNLFEAIQDPKIKSIKPLKPVKIDQSKPTKSQIPSLKPISLNQPLTGKKQEKNVQEKKEKLEDTEKHYIIPGTCFEGQFEYVTKQKKQEEVEKQLQQLDKEKRQLEISTEHYVNPSTVVEGPVKKADKKQKEDIIQKQQQEAQKENENQPKSKPHKFRETQRSTLKKTQFSEADTEGLKLLKENSADKRFIKMEIKSEQQGKLPYKIDEYTCMTVVSPQEQERPSLNLPFCEEPNDDLEIIVIETSLNKEATSPKDLVNERPKDVLGNNKMSEVIQNIKNRDGSPVKVVIGTKQFANYPGQSAPSPPIIDETTLSDFRRKNHSEFLQKNTVNNETNAFGIEAKNSEEGNPEEIEISRMNIKEKTTEIINEKEKLEIEHMHVTLDVDKIKKVEQNDKRGKPLLPKFIKSALFSSLVGGLAWLSLEDKKIAAVSAAGGFAVAYMLQR